MASRPPSFYVDPSAQAGVHSGSTGSSNSAPFIGIAIADSDHGHAMAHSHSHSHQVPAYHSGQPYYGQQQQQQQGVQRQRTGTVGVETQLGQAIPQGQAQSQQGQSQGQAGQQGAQGASSGSRFLIGGQGAVSSPSMHSPSSALAYMTGNQGSNPYQQVDGQQLSYLPNQTYQSSRYEGPPVARTGSYSHHYASPGPAAADSASAPYGRMVYSPGEGSRSQSGVGGMASGGASLLPTTAPSGSRIMQINYSSSGGTNSGYASPAMGAQVSSSGDPYTSRETSMGISGTSSPSAGAANIRSSYLPPGAAQNLYSSSQQQSGSAPPLSGNRLPALNTTILSPGGGGGPPSAGTSAVSGLASAMSPRTSVFLGSQGPQGGSSAGYDYQSAMVDPQAAATKYVLNQSHGKDLGSAGTDASGGGGLLPSYNTAATSIRSQQQPSHAHSSPSLAYAHTPTGENPYSPSLHHAHSVGHQGSSSSRHRAQQPGTPSTQHRSTQQHPSHALSQSPYLPPSPRPDPTRSHSQSQHHHDPNSMQIDYYASPIPSSATSVHHVAPPPLAQTTGFRKVRSQKDLKPVTAGQGVGGGSHGGQRQIRRRDSKGNLLSPLKALTTHLPETYNSINPQFRYELSHNPRRVLTKPSKPAGNNGYDNEDSDYILYVNDWLGGDEKAKERGQGRYCILDILGQGTFGQVVKCHDVKTNEICAVKVVKNKPAYLNQSMMEVTLLELLNNTYDPNDEHHILRLRDTFMHQNHLCLVFELLSSNLYELIKQNSFRGLSTSLVRVFTQQLLDALSVLNDARLIHCDLKPENILLKSLQSPQIKVIDFGSACHERQTVYTYIQSRFYRSPEVLLGLPYSSAIDMWSLGCICVELFLGLPLFPGTSEFNQISRIVEMLGMPPTYMLEVGKQATQFFDMYYDEYGRKMYRLKSIEQYSKEHNVQEQPSKKYFTATTLPEIIRSYPMARKGLKNPDHDKEFANRAAFIDFVQGLLNLNPIERWSPQQAKMHPFITGEPLKEPFRPPMTLKNPSMKPPSSPSAQPESAKKPFGGLPPTPQRSGTRTYQDAAAYNQHLAQQQAYMAQSSAEAYRQANYPTNPYAAQQQQEAAQAQAQAHAQAQAQKAAAAQSSAFGASASRLPATGSQPPLAGGGTNVYGVRGSASGPVGDLSQQAPAAHHYSSTRGRSTTIGQMDAVPPQLQKLGVDLSTYAGQSVTPILHREDQAQAWERRISNQQAGSGGLGRRVSVNRHDPQLAFLQEQAELNWPAALTSAHRSKQAGQGSYQSSPHHAQQAYPSTSGYYGGTPQQSTQPSFSVVVDGHERTSDRYGANAGGSGGVGQIAQPTQAYGSQQGRYPTYGGGGGAASGSNAGLGLATGSGGPAAAGGAYDATLDQFDDHRDEYASMLYQPMQPSRGVPTAAGGGAAPQGGGARRPSDGGLGYYPGGGGTSGNMAGVGVRGAQQGGGEMWGGR